MKNLCTRGGSQRIKWLPPAPPKKFWMKISFLLTSVLFVAVEMTIARPAYGQGLEEKVIHLNARNELLSDIFRTIEEQTSLHFAYNPVIIREYSASVKGEGLSVEEVLKSVLKDTPLQYQLINDKVLITMRPEREISRLQSNYTVPFLMRKGLLKVTQMTVEGKVVDQDNEPLIGVNIVIKGSDKEHHRATGHLPGARGAAYLPGAERIRKPGYGRFSAAR